MALTDSSSRTDPPRRQGFLHPGWRLSAMVVVLLALTVGCRQDGGVVEDPEAHIAAGWVEFRMGEYKRAAQMFGEVALGTDVDETSRLRALYGLGCTHWQKLPTADKPQARRIFTEIQELAPTSEYAAWSELALIRMDHIVPVGEKPDYPAIRQRYQALYERFPESMPGHEGFIYLAGTHIASLERGDLETAVTLLDQFIARHPDSPFISSGWFLRSRAAEFLARPEEMLEAKIRSLETVELDPSNPRMENSGRYWLIATTAEFEAGDFAVARDYYQRLIDEYPQDRRRFAAFQALDRLAALTAEFDREGTP